MLSFATAGPGMGRMKTRHGWVKAEAACEPMMDLRMDRGFGERNAGASQGGKPPPSQLACYY